MHIYDSKKCIDSHSWKHDRTLADMLPSEIEKLLIKNNIDWGSLSGVVVFQGPGSYTSLRITISVANTIAYAQKIPIVGTHSEKWIEQGIDKLINNSDDKIVTPLYGGAPHITKPKK